MGHERLCTSGNIQPDDRDQTPVRKPWRTPHIILSEVAGTNNGSVTNTDGNANSTC